MSKGKIIFYDDDPDFTKQFNALMSESGFEIETYNDLPSLRDALSQKDKMMTTRCLVFDLAKDKDEAAHTRDFEIIKDISEKFNELRIPIFIHSTYADQITYFDNCGTVWKIVKGGSSVEKVVSTIEELDNAGFLEVFTPGGLLEKNLFQDLHKSFTEQFREGEIEGIIQSIKVEGEYKSRAIEIFRRIALRSLLSDVLAPTVADKIGVNPIEHYYRRISHVDLWTGDILKSKDNGELLLIITPRCNVGVDENLLVCPVMTGAFPDKVDSVKEKERVKDALNNKPEVAGYNRYLPPSPVFKGGKVTLSKYMMLPRKTLNENFDRIISLSDELTNEILGKFGAYFFRTGITPWSAEEVILGIKQEKMADAQKG